MLLTLRYQGKDYQQFSKVELKEAGVPDNIILEAIKAAEISEVISRRVADYQKESDPLYMEWQYDQTAESEKAWRDKVAEIKARYPLPTEMQSAA
ncbi:hypothetical protein [Vibrio parahaemolyticus]|uniref:hypothetical protein n=1 Tax=Vibrio parahaemolyticus TaxID=670 RepID=UPI001783B95F|nr:hypothetical protein [Vibrio parahaemolyticus]MBD6946520.1 hypothetical protein [Vibrio parahaemolyticus]MBD6960112.1 hypothetical protein [Vibrio parahaemolyticus]MBD6979216.1 hypothetical protein [Vibrio parahaemolyticus]MBD6992317.1 hypothetical protein [Vibrio parahaemolyticus]